MKETILQNGCNICGDELQYHPAELKDLGCYYCGKEKSTDVSCGNGHFICDNCHQSSANGVIEQYCNKTLEKDPGLIMQYLMDSGKLAMHGPEHHYLVAAALVAAYYNSKDQPRIKTKKLRMALRRAEQVPGGFCGSHGNCGAGVATGIFVSLITEATPLTTDSWQLSNLITAQSLYKIALSGGPRCCKRDSFIATEQAILFVNEKLDAGLSINNISCRYHKSNRQCLGKNCQFFPEN